MNIKFLDLKAQYDSIKNEIDTGIAGVIESSSFALGPAVKRFEEHFADYCGVRHVIAVDSGTSALFLILKGLGVGPGEEIITAANTFIATVAAIVHTGARPVLVDVDRVTRNINPARIEAAITTKTRVIVPVHLYGSMAEMDAIENIARKKNIMVVEDAAQAQGARYKNRRSGSIGVAAGFSFYPGKNLGAYGEAGAITTSDDNLAATLRRLRDHGSDKKYYHDLIGYNARMDGIQGAVLDVKLRHLDGWNARRNQIAGMYGEKLSELPIRLPAQLPDHYQVYHQYVIETDRRDQLQEFLLKNGIPTMIHYPIPVHKQEAFRRAGLTADCCPVTESLAERILSLPIYPELHDEQIEYIAEKTKEFFAS
nr:DegT/DnrJ/EryC1/StrS family aminotransferase [candidate division Zixibacteria bacterium]